MAMICKECNGNGFFNLVTGRPVPCEECGVMKCGNLDCEKVIKNGVYCTKECADSVPIPLKGNREQIEKKES